MNIENYLKYIGIILLCISSYSCSKDDNNNSNNFATGIVELPALRNGANDVFIAHSTTFNPSIPIQHQRTSSDFGNRFGYYRGHICASADRLYSREVNEQTFYYTNMSPQSWNFNGGIWLSLEGKVQSWGRSCTASDTLYVVKGGTIDKEEQIRGYINNDLSKPIPKYYYMALLFKKGESFKAIAFWMEHSDTPKSTKLVDYALSIDELEEKTGIDFFPSLNDNLENALEATYSTKAWPGLE